jgi:hypothetical protein
MVALTVIAINAPYVKLGFIWTMDFVKPVVETVLNAAAL